MMGGRGIGGGLPGFAGSQGKKSYLEKNGVEMIELEKGKEFQMHATKKNSSIRGKVIFRFGLIYL